MKKRLRIAQIAPLIERVPPKKYGGTERVVNALTEELVKRGHDVTLFASGDSITKAQLNSIYPRALREAKVKNSQKLDWSIYHIGRVYAMHENFDLIHDHNSTFGVPLASLVSTPTVITLHGAIRSSNKKLFETFNNINFVSISKDQIKPLKNAQNIVTILNGLNFTDYPFNKNNKKYLLFIGRIAIEKGVHHAIDVAEALNLPLIIAAKLDDTDMPYFREYVESRLYNDQITWVGEVDDQQRNELLSNALCLLSPITWREPFGLNMIEALACGCPVVAFDSGSVPEIIKNGKTGFIVENIDEMIAAVENIHIIDRQACRTFAFTKFNEKVMTKRYENLYYKILSKKINKIRSHKKKKISIESLPSFPLAL